MDTQVCNYCYITVEAKAVTWASIGFYSVMVGTLILTIVIVELVTMHIRKKLCLKSTKIITGALIICWVLWIFGIAVWIRAVIETADGIKNLML